MTAPRLVVCMGVSGSGKSTLGAALADQLDLPFLDADDLHAAQDRQQMGRGSGLTDEQRTAWMDRVCRELSTRARRGESCILAHSALHANNRERLRSCGLMTRFVFLDIEAGAVARRLTARTGHFVTASLVPSQFRALERPVAEDDVVIVQADKPLDALILRTRAAVADLFGIDHSPTREAKT